MTLEKILKNINKELQTEIEEQAKLIFTLKREMENLRIENQRLSAEIYEWEQSRIVKIINVYRSSADKYPIIRFFGKCLLSPLVFSYRIHRKFAKKKDACTNNILVDEIQEIILSTNNKEVIFFMSTVDWDIPLHQRPQHIAKYLAEEDILYFYIVKYSAEPSIRELYPKCYEVQMQGEDCNYIETILQNISNRKFFLQTYSTEYSNLNGFISRFKKMGGYIIYEYIDEITPDLLGAKVPENVFDRFEECVKDENNTYFIASATRLYNDARFYRSKKLALITNGVEYDHFHRKFTKKDLPLRLLRIYSEGKPIIGYYGAIAKWMDYELIKEIANNRKEWNFVFIGVDYDGSVASSGIDKCSNVFILDSVDYKILPKYAYFFDVCMIPFAINEITKSTSPIKLFEYMALNKPIVTTAMPECKKYKSVLIANNSREFEECLEKALMLREDDEYIQMLDDEAKKNTWQEKAHNIAMLLKE